jgi:peroxiredoxin
MNTNGRTAFLGGIAHYHIRHRARILVIATMTLFCVCETYAAEINSPAPDFSLPVLSLPIHNNNETVSLSSLKGQTVIVNFWASWCKPCRKEIPELNNIYEKFKAQGFNIVGINIDKEKPNAELFMERIPIQYTVAFDPDMTVINEYKARGMPSSFIIDKNGVVREIVYGFSEKKKALIESSITALLNE